MRSKSSAGALDLGYPVSSLGMRVNQPIAGPNATNTSHAQLYEVQMLRLSGTALSAGTFTLGFNGEVTPPIGLAATLDAAQRGDTAALAGRIQAALNNLASIGSVGVSARLGLPPYISLSLPFSPLYLPISPLYLPLSPYR